METSDREPKYLGTHRGVARVQIGWTTLYFRGDAYTHALGSLYGTQESPSYQEIAAARKVIPVVPRPPVMANAPTTERAGSRKAESAKRANPAAGGKKDSPPREKPTPKPKASAEKTPRAKAASTPVREPAKAKEATEPPKRHAVKPKASRESKSTGKSGGRKPAEAPIATMAELIAKVEAPTGQGTSRDARPIGSMADLTAQLS